MLAVSFNVGGKIYWRTHKKKRKVLRDSILVRLELIKISVCESETG